MKLSDEARQLLFDSLDNLDIPYRSYSGRAMYGRKCLGITFSRDSSSVKVVCNVLAQVHAVSMDALESAMNSENEEVSLPDDPFEEIQTALSQSREDSMGLDGIVYWPQIEFSE